MGIKSFMKKRLKKYQALYAIIKVINNRKDELFLSYVNGYNENPTIIKVEPKKSISCNNKPVCSIVAGTENDGFFACLRWALDGAYFCEMFNFQPRILFHENSMYRDELVFNKNVNPFNYYFESTCNEQDIVDCPSIVYEKRNMLLAEQFNGGITYEVSAEYIDAMAYIMRKYIQFKTDVLEKAKDNIDDIGIDEYTLGVHIRGTDYRNNYKDHPLFVEAENYYTILDSVLEKGFFKKIFLATDDQDLLEEFVARYGNLVIYSTKTTRTVGTVGVHTQIHENKSPYYLGLEVVLDMMALSACGGIVSGMSQVALNTRIYKKSKGEKFCYDIILSKGVNKHKKDFSINKEYSPNSEITPSEQKKTPKQD